MAPAPTAVCPQNVEMCIHISGFETNLDIAVGDLFGPGGEESTGGAGGEPPGHKRLRLVELLNDRAEPAAEMPHLGCAAAEERQQRPGTGSRPEKVRQRMRALLELDRFDAGLVEEHRTLEDVHRRRVEPWTEV